MKKMMLFLGAAAVLLVGFSMLGSETEPELEEKLRYGNILIDPPYDTIRIPEDGYLEISASFENRSWDPVYVFISSGAAPAMRLEKLRRGNWERVNTRRPGVAGHQAVRYRKVEPGEFVTTTFPHRLLEELGQNIPGEYRYVMTITHRENDLNNHTLIYSRPFLISGY